MYIRGGIHHQKVRFRRKVFRGAVHGISPTVAPLQKASFFNPKLESKTQCRQSQRHNKKTKAMKKILLTLAMAVATTGAAFAQQGQMAAGINLGVVPSLESNLKATNFQLGAKFQYGITDAIRGEVDLEYGFKAKGISVFDVTVNGHYLIPVADNFKIYPLVGLGYASLKQDLGAAMKGMSFEDFLSMSGMSESYFDQLPGYMQDQIEDEFDNAIAAAKKDSKSESVSRFVFNIGVGGEYDLTENLSLNLEIKYQYMKDFNRMPILLGVAYKF